MQLARVWRFTPFLIVITPIALATACKSVPEPATTQPAATRPSRGRGPVVRTSRDELPFTNTDFKKVNPALPTLFIAGDSTAATGDPTHRGWGALLVDYFDTSKINLVNNSQGGASFPSYFAGRWPAIDKAIRPGDFVIIELGHNGGHLDGTGDETASGPSRTRGNDSVTLHTYGWYVRKFIADAKGKGATPIVSSTTVRNIWTNPNATFNEAKITEQKPGYDPADDRVERGMGRPLDNGERTMLVWARETARQQSVPFIDHSNIAADVYEKMGREAVQRFHPADRTHFGTEGAVVQADTLIAGIRAQPDLALNKYLNEKGRSIAPYVPKSR